jgi:hypothetical protein
MILYIFYIASIVKPDYSDAHFPYWRCRKKFDAIGKLPVIPLQAA